MKTNTNVQRSVTSAVRESVRKRLSGRTVKTVIVTSRIPRVSPIINTSLPKRTIPCAKTSLNVTHVRRSSTGKQGHQKSIIVERLNVPFAMNG